MPNRVFISYASLDQGEADKIVAEIERRGIPCWISKRDIPPGADYQRSIVAAVQAAGAFLLLFSENASRSSEIPRELALAGKYKKVLIPARMQDILPTGAFEYPLTSAQYIDLFRDFDVNLAALCHRLAQLLELDAATTERLRVEEQRKIAAARRRDLFRRLKRSAGGLAAVAALVAVLVSAGYVWHQWAGPGAAAPATAGGTVTPAGESGVASGGEPPPAATMVSVPMPSVAVPAGDAAAAAALPPAPPAEVPVLNAAAAGGPAAPVPPTAVDGSDLDRMFRAETTARASGAPYAVGSYATVDGTRYVLNGPCVSLPDRTSWSLERLTAPDKPSFTAVWTSGPAAGHPDLANTKAEALPAGYDYGIADDNGRRALIRVQQIGGAVTIAEYGDPNEPPVTPSQKLTLARTP